MDNHPPFRAEHIGSLLRPGDLLALRQKFSAGEIARDELAAAETLAIKEAVGCSSASAQARDGASSGGAPTTATF
jgi:hypothetical protein